MKKNKNYEKIAPIQHKLENKESKNSQDIKDNDIEEGTINDSQLYQKYQSQKKKHDLKKDDARLQYFPSEKLTKNMNSNHLKNTGEELKNKITKKNINEVQMSDSKINNYNAIKQTEQRNAQEFSKKTKPETLNFEENNNQKSKKQKKFQNKLRCKSVVQKTSKNSSIFENLDPFGQADNLLRIIKNPVIYQDKLQETLERTSKKYQQLVTDYYQTFEDRKVALNPAIKIPINPHSIKSLQIYETKIKEKMTIQKLSHEKKINFELGKLSKKLFFKKK